MAQPAIKRTVAIAGAGGNVGKIIANTFVEPRFREWFKDVIVLARASTAETQQLVDSGATLRLYDMRDLSAAFEDVDVFINAIGPAGAEFRDQLLTGLKESNVKLYFPSEFGVNHYIHDFPHEEWDTKKRHFSLIDDLNVNQRTHICRVYPGLLLEDSIGPWFGFNTTLGVYEAVGDPGQLCSFTSKYDLAKALAVLASAPISKWEKSVHLSGDLQSFFSIAELMKRAGSGPIELKSIPLWPYKQSVLQDPTPTPERYLRFLIGEGNIAHRSGIGLLPNQNHIVDSNPAFGRWKTMQDLAQETNGKPWADELLGSIDTN